MDAAARLVAAGHGAAVLPREAVELHTHADGLVMVPLSDVWALRRFVLCTWARSSIACAR